MKIGDVVRACARQEGLTLEEFWPHGRGWIRKSRPQVRARRLAAIVLRDEGLSYPAIARALGYEDHTSVMSLLWHATPLDYDAAVAISLSLQAAVVA